jgi:glucose-1-phosphate cytidylyltransferase
MKVVILAGGLGTRLAEETEIRPKPMIEIGGLPILWHIMKIYSQFKHNEFFIALGYKGELIKRFFVDYCALGPDMTISIGHGKVERHAHKAESWTVHLIDTGEETMTGGRLKRLQPWLKDEPFMLTYGDGVADVNLTALLKFHRAHKKISTITAVRPPSRFGGLVFKGNLISEFSEKPQVGEGWINGGFMVFQAGIFKYLKDDRSILEIDGLEKLAAGGQLVAYKHAGFWQCMDTLRDKRFLEKIWNEKKAPWKTW